MFIMGWGHRTRNVEATFARHCEKCSRSQMFRLERVRTWFSLLFLPVVPYENQYWLLCSECRCGTRLTQEEYERISVELAADIQPAYMTLHRT